MQFPFADRPDMKVARRPDEEVDEEEFLEEEDEDETREALAAILPWAVSFVIHAALVVIAVMLVWTLKTVTQPKVPPPDCPVVDEVPGEPEEMETTEQTDSESAPMCPSPDISTPTPVPSTTTAAVSAIGSTFKGGSPGGSIGSGRGTGTGMFGGGSGGGGQRNVVYIIDASGSLVDTLPFVVEELTKIFMGKAFNAGYKFNVIFFAGKGFNGSMGGSSGLAVFSRGLKKADAKARQNAVKWVRQAEAGGSGNPMDALKKAMSYNPDQIHVLSDNITGRGIWEMHQEKFIAEYKKELEKAVARRGGKTIQVMTYQFVYQDPMVTIGKQPTLKRMVQEAGGNVEKDYIFVSPKALGLR